MQSKSSQNSVISWSAYRLKISQSCFNSISLKQTLIFILWSQNCQLFLKFHPFPKRKFSEFWSDTFFSCFCSHVEKGWAIKFTVEYLDYRRKLTPRLAGNFTIEALVCAGAKLASSSSPGIQPSSVGFRPLNSVLLHIFFCVNTMFKSVNIMLCCW